MQGTHVENPVNNTPSTPTTDHAIQTRQPKKTGAIILLDKEDYYPEEKSPVPDSSPQPTSTRGSSTTIVATTNGTASPHTAPASGLRALAEISVSSAKPEQPQPRIKFWLTATTLLIGRRKVLQPNNPTDTKINFLDLSEFPKANTISRKHIVITALSDGDFRVETFARNATLLGQEPLLAGHPRTVRLPFELSFSELVVQVTPPSQPFVPDSWVLTSRGSNFNPWFGPVSVVLAPLKS